MRSLKFKIHTSKRITSFLLPIVSCLFIISCASSKVSKTVTGEYSAVLDEWTRKGKVYDNFETKLLITATYKGREFRDAYINEYSKVYLLDAETKTKVTEEEMEALKTCHEFFIAVHTPVIEWSDLDKKPSVWALYLANDQDERVMPLEIKRVREKTATDIRFYPYYDDWSKAFTAKFPLSPGDTKSLVTDKTKFFKLIITGPPGKTELIWNLMH